MRIDLQLFAGEKTEPATPRKREEARRKGQVAKSSELGVASMLLAGFFALRVLGQASFERLGGLVGHFLSSAHEWDGSSSGAQAMFGYVVSEGLMVLLPIFGIMLLTVIVAQGLQVGVMLTLENLQPKFSRINPLEGAKRILSKRALVELLKSVIKITIVGSLAYMQVRSSMDYLPQLIHIDQVHSLLLVANSVFNLAMWIGLALLCLALLDYLYQRWEFEENLKMSKQEIKDEYKQSEGDPQVRSKIRQKQREMSSSRMMQDVPSADVVITNPTHFAVALRYEPNQMAAPQVVAKGAGHVAQRMKEIGREHGVTIVENPALARALYRSVEIGREVPAELYPAVAEVLAFVYRLRRRRR